MGPYNPSGAMWTQWFPSNYRVRWRLNRWDTLLTDNNRWNESTKNWWVAFWQYNEAFPICVQTDEHKEKKKLLVKQSTCSSNANCKEKEKKVQHGLPPTWIIRAHCPFLFKSPLGTRQGNTALSCGGQWSGRTGSYLQMNRLSLRNKRLKLKIAGKLPILIEEII